MALATIAYVGAERVESINAVVVGLVLSVVIVNIAGERLAVDQGVTDFFLKRVLKVAVILLGAGISLAAVTSLGMRALGVIAGSVTLAMAVSWIIGRRVGLSNRASTLIGVGTAICGASAIAAVAPILRARKEEIGMALATVFGFNAVALALYPTIGSALGLSEIAFGAWAGMGVHDTASAVATGFAYGATSGEIATLVKLERTLFLIPLLAISVAVAQRDRVELTTRHAIGSSFPWFIVGFLVLALANTLGWIDTLVVPATQLAKLLIVLVVVAIGLTLRWRRVASLGRPLLVTGLIASATVAGFSLVAIQFIGIE